MKKLIALAAVAILMVAGSASAQWSRHAVAQPNATFTFGVGGAAEGPTTTNNDDTCDIANAPAATLLLPYFEVETASRATTTFFTIINTSAVPQVAHVTLWTDWSYPVLDFNIFLTGYDVQPIDLYDILVNGTIAPGTGSGGTGVTNDNTTDGALNGGSGSTYNPYNMTGNPNFAATVSTDCASLPGQVRGDIITAVRNALVTGTGYNGTGFGCAATNQIGSPAANHTTPTTAVGYATVDVAATCNQFLPSDPAYYSSASGILYDNVLTGDYEIINKAAGSNYAGGNPLVHIRAIPEGGPAASLPPGTTNFPYTFYSRYINVQGTPFAATNNRDRRQPLPSVFAARYIQGGALALNTNYRIWREGVTGPTAALANSVFPTLTCTNASSNSAIAITEIDRFDEHENVQTLAPGGCNTSPCPTGLKVALPETSSTSVSNNTIFPPNTFTSGDVGGWMYLNLNAGGVTGSTYPATVSGGVNTTLHTAWPAAGRASQNWVIVALSGSGSTAGQYGVDFDATWLGNGCSGPIPTSMFNGGTGFIGPVGGTPICPTGVTCTAVAGAAPYVTNASPLSGNVTP